MTSSRRWSNCRDRICSTSWPILRRRRSTPCAILKTDGRRPTAWAQAEVLATAVGLDMTTTWAATAASYFSRVAKARMLEAVEEAVGMPDANRIAGFKKGDMAEAAELLVAATGWLPPLLRTATRPDVSELEAVSGRARRGRRVPVRRRLSLRR